MIKIINSVLRIIFILFILFLVTRIFKSADEKSFKAENSAFIKGNAPDSIRKNVLGQLQKFQEGYYKRDVSQADSFMRQLYSANNILVLGTMPGEIFAGYEAAANLVKSDWESWGDCRFVIDNASISSNGDVAWFSTRGSVEFDLSALLVLPLRLSGVMVKEAGIWKFQQQQFQFDTDFSFSILATLVLLIWLVISVISLSILVVKTFNHNRLKVTADSRNKSS